MSEGAGSFLMRCKMKCGGRGLVLFFACTSLVFAHGGDGGGAKPQQSRAPAMVNMADEDRAQDKELHGKVIHEKSVNAYKLRLKVVSVTDSVPDGGSHNLLVNIRRDGRTQYKLKVSSTVEEVSDTEKSKSKSMMELGDWYLAGYDMSPDGEYFITVSFKSADGETHSSSLVYP